MEFKDEVSQKIITSTFDLINEYGYERLSLRKITRLNSVTTGSFYLRFSSKNDLLMAVAQYISSKLVKEIDPKIKNYQSNPQNSLLELGLWIINEFNNNPNLMEVLFFNSSLSRIYQDKGLQNSFPLLILAKKIIKANLNNPHRTEKVFIQLWSFIQGYGNLISKNICTIDRELMRDTLLKIIR